MIAEVYGELYILGSQVSQTFRALQNTQTQDGHRVDPSFNTLKIEETNDRFVLWASNVGLFNPDHSSLDYRLRDNEEIKHFTTNLLQTLDDKARRRKIGILSSL